MQTNKAISFLGYASGIAANNPGCGDGPLVLEQSNLITELKQSGLTAEWQKILRLAAPIEKEHESNKTTLMSSAVLSGVTRLCKDLAQHTFQLAQQQQLFTVFGGDHSCAVGTWSGVAAARAPTGPIGLIWIDAHMDSHTPETTETGNIHGMPLACLLGHGASELTNILTKNPKLRPEHVSLIGVRSFEVGEAELLKRLGVREYGMEEINHRGIGPILAEAIKRASTGTVGYGLSIDLDGIDPKDAPGVGSPEPDGISGLELCKALAEHVRGDSHLLGVEIVEFNPHLDNQELTQKLIQQLLLSIY